MIKKYFKNIGKILTYIIFLYGLVQAILGLYNITDKYIKNFSCKQQEAPVLFTAQSNSIDTNKLDNETVYKNIKNINTGATNQYINKFFGEPFLVRKVPKCINNSNNKRIKTNLEDFTERIYKDNRFYLQTISDPSDRVIAYSVTTLMDDFNPDIPLTIYTGYFDEKDKIVTKPLIIDLKLGKTKFSEIKESNPENSGFGTLGQEHFYLESHYFGNPGNYKYYLFGVSPYGTHSNEESYDKMIQISFDYGYGEEEIPLFKNKTFLSWRDSYKFNSFGIIDSFNDNALDISRYLFYYGLGPNILDIHNLK